MKPRLLVVSPVHPPDDPRIRHKLIRTLQDDWDVTFAGRGRGPVDREGIEWTELVGGRARRWLQAARLLLGKGYDVASVHDPELLPAAIAAATLGRSIVFDVHENVPAQLRTKAWVPSVLRRPLAWFSGRLLRMAEAKMKITLAEANYGNLFAGPHPVFPNYLHGDLPTPVDPDSAIGIVYLGDVTPARGLAVAVEAAAAAGVDAFTIMGRCDPGFRAHLQDLAGPAMKLGFHGFVAPDRALHIASRGSVAVSPLLDIPNYRESLPTKVLEYLAVGVPTLASDLPGTRAVVGDKPGVILVPPGDVASWESAIRSAVGDPMLRGAARRGVTAITDVYMWPRDTVRAFYKSLLVTSR